MPSVATAARAAPGATDGNVPASMPAPHISTATPGRNRSRPPATTAPVATIAHPSAIIRATGTCGARSSAANNDVVALAMASV
jgi:hypothetical protein